MKIVGLLCWFDENPAWLQESVGSALTLCDEVVALDGAYRGFPGARMRSGPDQEHAIQQAGGIPSPAGKLWESQVEKRTELFRIGLTRDPDWFLVFDADNLLAHVPFDARQRLENATEHVAVYTSGGNRYHRGLFRALPSIRVEDAHYHYLAEHEGRTIHLRGEERVHPLEPFANLTDMKMLHRSGERTPKRAAAKRSYRAETANVIEPVTPEEWANVAA